MQIRFFTTRRFVHSSMKISVTLQVLSFAMGSFSYSFPNLQNSFPRWMGSRTHSSRPVSIDFDPKNQLDTSFRMAIKENRLKDAQRYLNQGADVNSRSPEGITALMYASRNCAVEAVELILKHGASANIRDDGGRTALIYATRETCEKIVQILLKDRSIKADVKDYMQKSALDYAYKSALLEVHGPAEKIIKMIQAHNKKKQSLNQDNRSIAYMGKDKSK